MRLFSHFATFFRETNESGFDTFDDADVTKHMSLFEVGDLYLMMGRELENLEEVPTGNIVGKLHCIFLQIALNFHSLFFEVHFFRNISCFLHKFSIVSSN